MKKNIFINFILFVFCTHMVFSFQDDSVKKDLNENPAILESIWCLALDSDDSNLLKNAKKIINDFCTDWQNSDQNFRSGLFSLNDDTRETCLSFAYVIQNLNSLQEFSSVDYISKVENRLGCSYGDLWIIQQQIISSCEVYNEQNQKIKTSLYVKPLDSSDDSIANKNMKKQNLYLRAQEINAVTTPTEDLLFEIVSSPDLFYILNNSKRYQHIFYKLFLTYFDPDSEISVENIVLPISSNTKISETVDKINLAGKLRLLVDNAEQLSRQYGISVEPTVSPLCKQIGSMISFEKTLSDTFEKTLSDAPEILSADKAGSFSKEGAIYFSNAILQFSKKEFENAIKQYTEACLIISSIGEKSFLVAKKTLK